MRVFLDANVIFSAALGGESFARLWQMRASVPLVLCTSPQCADETRRNIARKRPDRAQRVDEILDGIELGAAPDHCPEWAVGLLPDDDAWVLAGALAQGAAILFTGNTRHFGVLMTRTDLPLRVMTVRAFLDVTG